MTKKKTKKDIYIIKVDYVTGGRWGSGYESESIFAGVYDNKNAARTSAIKWIDDLRGYQGYCLNSRIDIYKTHMNIDQCENKDIDFSINIDALKSRLRGLREHIYETEKKSLEDQLISEENVERKRELLVDIDSLRPITPKLTDDLITEYHRILLANIRKEPNEEGRGYNYIGRYMR